MEKPSEKYEATQISIEDIRRYVLNGYLLYSVSSDKEFKANGIRYIAVVNPNQSA